MEKKSRVKDKNVSIRGAGKGGGGTIYPAQKGEVRNPNGKPKGTLAYATILENVLSTEIKQKDGTTTTYKELIIKKFAAAALSQEATLSEIRDFIKTSAAFLGEDPGTKLTVEGEITAREKMPESYEFIITPPGEADEG
jgi:hypothetical protein